MSKGTDLTERVVLRIRIDDQEYSLHYGGGLPWQLLEEKYGGPLLSHTVPAVFDKLIRGSTADVLYIAWCGFQYLGDKAPSVEQIQKLNVFDLVIGETGPDDSPLCLALLAALPKVAAPVAVSASKTVKTGIGSLLFTWLRSFLGGRRTISGTK